MKQNILLTGFMGAGKSSTARALAELTGLFAVDTDDLIESLWHCSIKSLFASRGEAFFRAQEQRLANWIFSSLDHTIIATGGGFHLVNNLMDLGQVCFLDADFEVICCHLGVGTHSSQTATRPLFQNPEAARKRYEERLPQYRQRAHHLIPVPAGQDSHDTARQIRDLLLRCHLLPNP